MMQLWQKILGTVTSFVTSPTLTVAADVLGLEEIGKLSVI